MTLEKYHLATLGLHSNLALTRIAIALLGVTWSLISTFYTSTTHVTTSPVSYP